jgi:hypothetical protein
MVPGNSFARLAVCREPPEDASWRPILELTDR